MLMNTLPFELRTEIFSPPTVIIRLASPVENSISPLADTVLVADPEGPVIVSVIDMRALWRRWVVVAAVSTAFAGLTTGALDRMLLTPKTAPAATTTTNTTIRVRRRQRGVDVLSPGKSATTPGATDSDPKSISVPKPAAVEP
jgi:hypothetical protein